MSEGGGSWFVFIGIKQKKDHKTWTSQVVTHPNTTQARSGLTTDIGWDPVISSWYGHNQLNLFFKQINQQNKLILQKRLQDVDFPSGHPP